HVRVHLEVRGTHAVVDAYPERVTINSHPLAVVLACRRYHRLAGSILRFIPPHEFGYHRAQIVDIASSRMVYRVVVGNDPRDNHALAKPLRGVRYVCLT